MNSWLRANSILDRVEAEASRTKVPVAVCVIDTHGNIILKHRMSGAPVFAIEISERKAYTSALVGMRTADLLPLVQPGQELFAVMKFERASSTPGVHECQQWRRLACGQRPALTRRILGDLRRRGAEAGLLTPLISATAPQDMEPGLRPTLHERLPII